EEQRKYFRSLIAEWRKQNKLKITNESQRGCNLERIDMLEYML
ncbi:ABC transporter permease, partial [Bacillus paranthracis]|nr:ABC transporter permease [Bacillus paranthracis]